MPIPGNLLTTAMAVMPHRDVDRALEMALSLDIPFWPQLPLLSYYEDMYVQASENFPGIVLDIKKRSLRFSMDKFVQEFENYMDHMEDTGLFDVSAAYSSVYSRFLELPLDDRPAIRGQMEGPVSFGLNVTDEDGRPMIFNDNVRPLMFEFLARRVNVQLTRLKKRNDNAFMFVDEPGMQFLFSGMAGYNEQSARKDLLEFFRQIDRPRGIHLCGNPDWDFLLALDLDVLSLDAYSNGEIFASYHAPLKRFLERGGAVVWGIVPTNIEPFQKEDKQSLRLRLESIWEEVFHKGIDRDLLLSRSLLSPATCCLINPDGQETVEEAFGMVQALAAELRNDYGIA